MYPRAKGSGTRCKLGVRRKPKTAEVKKPSPTSRRAGAELCLGKRVGGMVERMCTEPVCMGHIKGQPFAGRLAEGRK